MPKQTKIISRFDGGLNTKSNAKDIADHEASSLQNVMLNQVGTLQTCAKPAVDTTNYDGTQEVQHVQAGYGLFQTSMDFKEDNSNTTNIKTILAADNGNDSESQMYDAEDGGDWTADRLTILGGTSQKIIYHLADGAIRYCDTAFGGSSRVRWYGHIKRLHFAGLSGAPVVQYNDYFTKDNDLAPPTEIQDTHLTYISTGTAGAGISVEASQSVDDGEWKAADYDIGATFIYDDDQESLLKISEDHFTSADDDKSVAVSVYVKAPYDPRISGMRLYIRKNATNDPWVLLMDISLRDGHRTQLENDYKGWYQIGSTVFVLSSTHHIERPNIDTYETINGFSPDEKSISIGAASQGYKTSVVTNSRTFVANVKAYNSDGEEVHMPDRIMYSQVAKYDTFPTSNFIDIGINDGDEFIKLEAFADRLFAFKKKKVYVINISGGSDVQWFLETEHTSLGVKSVNAVTNTDFGIIWANENGLYFYDGKSIVNLQNKIDDNDWFTYANTEKIMIGYVPKTKEVVILNEHTATNDKNAYIFHVPTKSFTYIKAWLPTAYTFTNMLLDTNGKLVTFGWSGAGGNADTMYAYDGTRGDIDESEITFKYDDLGDPIHIKRLYKVMVNSRADDTQARPWSYKFMTSAGVNTAGTMFGDMAASGSNPNIDEFLFNADRSPLVAQAIELKFNPDGTTDPTAGVESTWEINDVSLVYRTIKKNVAGS